jgi:hypothetical protein
MLYGTEGERRNEPVGDPLALQSGALFVGLESSEIVDMHSVSFLSGGCPSEGSNITSCRAAVLFWRPGSCDQ